MRISAPALRRRRPLSLTSLIDVIFLLLLFFMLSSTFTRFARVEISGGPAAASSSAETPDALVHLDADGNWRVNGGAPTGEDAAIAALGRLGENGAESTVLLIRGDLTSQTLVSAVERIRQDTDLTLSIAR